MDQYGLDEYSLVNFAAGLLWYQAGFSFMSLLIVFGIFKLLGNTSMGLYLVDKYLTPITGYKLTSESYQNIGLDLGFCFAGWMAGHLFIRMGFVGLTGALIGFAGYYFRPELITKYIIYIGPGLAAGGLLFRQLWYVLLGMGGAYAMNNFKVVKSA
jgi:hypothetical protein